MDIAREFYYDRVNQLFINIRNLMEKISSFPDQQTRILDYCLSMDLLQQRLRFGKLPTIFIP